MKTLAITLVLLLGSSAQAANLQYADGALRVTGGASGRGRSVWARGRTLVIVLPPGKLASETLRVGKAGVRDVRVLRRRNRTDVELRLVKAAEAMIGKIDLREDGSDLLVVVDRAAARHAAEVRAERSRERAKAAAEKAATAAKSPTAGGVVAAQKAPSAAPKAGQQPTVASSQAKVARRPAWLRRKGTVTGGGQAGGSNESRSRLWLMAGLLLVGGATALYLRRRRRGGASVPTDIDVLSSRSLGGKQRLVLVEVEGERLLLACTDKDVRMLHAVQKSADVAPATDQQTLQALLELQSSPSPVDELSQRPQAGRFVEQLERQLAQVREQRVAPPVEQPLDEKWAEGIRRLRRAQDQRSRAGEWTPETVHGETPSRGGGVSRYVA